MDGRTDKPSYRDARTHLKIDAYFLVPSEYMASFLVGQNNPKSRLEYGATRLSVRLIACITHSFARLLTSLTPSWESEFLMSQNDLVLSHSGV